MMTYYFVYFCHFAFANQIHFKGTNQHSQKKKKKHSTNQQILHKVQKMVKMKRVERQLQIKTKIHKVQWWLLSGSNPQLIQKMFSRSLELALKNSKFAFGHKKNVQMALEQRHLCLLRLIIYYLFNAPPAGETWGQTKRIQRQSFNKMLLSFYN